MRIRTVPTASGASAVQVVRYQDGKTKVIKHIGSGRNKNETAALKQLAKEWIDQESGQNRLPGWPEESSDQLLLGKYRYLGFRYGLMAEIILAILNHFGLRSDSFPSAGMFLNLVLARILQPGSKRQTQKILADAFGIRYSLTDIYTSLPGLVSFQELAEEKLIDFAKSHLSFDFSFVFYDITTLYFETFQEDRLRKIGFSKDNKPGQPQILIGLVVESHGFPLSFSLFTGNKFEGKTLIPVILGFKQKHGIDNLTVVADAAMISQKNIRALQKANLNYIVGARLGNAGLSVIADVSARLNRVDGANLKIPTPGGFLICHFSQSRYAKDRHERQKQLDKAKQILAGRRPAIRNRFLTKNSKTMYSLNTALADKTELLLGIKGYHTNLEVPEQLVIDRYRDLWQIEKSFRLSKNDLEARPVYHFKKQTIAAHIFICMAALAVLKWLEIATGNPAKRLVDKLKSVTDARMLNTVTGKEVLMRAKVPPELSLLLEKIRPH